MEFEFNKLRGKIREKFITEQNFAKVLNMNRACLSARLNRKTHWKLGEIQRIVELLDIKPGEIPSYFFEEVSEVK